MHIGDKVYIMEFKLDSSAQSALEQIRDKRYGDVYLAEGKEVIALGISFSSEKKEVEEILESGYRELIGNRQ